MLLLTALLLIVVSAMLFSAGREALIAGLHRDALIAEELAQTGLDDVLRRLEGGRAWKPGALPPVARCVHADGTVGVHAGVAVDAACVAVVPRLAGAGGALLEVRTDGAFGRARRRIGAVILSRTVTALPETVVLHSLVEDAGTQITGGLVHARTFVAYASEISAARTTYAGWRISAAPGGGLPGAGSCYTHAQCAAAGRPQWWPGHRRAVHAGRPLRAAPLPANPTPDLRIPGIALDFPCPQGPPLPRAVQFIGTDGPGFQSGDLRADLDPADPLQSAVAAEPLYGCTADGLPYSWTREAFDTDDDADADPDRALWFRIVRLDHWMARYVCFDERVLLWRPCNGFHPDPGLGDPALGAALPPPPADLWMENHDRQITGGGVLTPADLDLGRCADPPTCAAPGNARSTVALAGGDYTLICPGTCQDGFGILLVGGDLTVTGAFTYRGAIVISGRLAVSAGGALTVHGMVSARTFSAAGGALRVDAGAPVAVGVAGPAGVSRKAWWER